MSNSFAELKCIRTARRYGIPQGILDPNGVVVVFNPNGGTNNVASLILAIKMHPTLWLTGMTVDFS